MIQSSNKKSYWLGLFVFVFFGGLVLAQENGGPRPMLQEIRVVKDDPYPNPTAGPTPLVRRTSRSLPRNPDIVTGTAISANPIRTSIPMLAETAIPGTSGIIVESLEGNIVVESGSHIPLNPASNVKTATSYAVLKAFGPNHRFSTNIWTDGVYDAGTASINGNLYVSGLDPVFSFEDAVRIANELNRIGIRVIHGDLIVTDNFTMNYAASPVRSSQTLFTTLDASRRSPAATRAWGAYRINSGLFNQLNEVPGITFTGSVYVQPLPSELRLLFSHESAPMRDIVKVMMSYSNNFLSERLGDTVGGPYAIARVVQQDTGSTPMEFSLQTASGLGINRVTAAAMMRLLRVFRSQLSGWDMTFADVMPVAGMDAGTLEGRFATDFSRGSVVGKTGTLARTDSGVSTLAGEISTREGTFLFVIFNQRGAVARFRSFQNNYVSLIQGQFGGASPVRYAPQSLDSRLARTRISYPDGRPRISE
ncbi:MAG TPA: D-alanyl-D-alanine carboxypeptidase [Pyrinomonadaceae bacterium]|nr:D-alanyl-D-alanine carboxypeptidase [Pyrinomonadaceae bacterium]HMP64565.1 D-alanyl-D-alanine carboxypeptidase [Pyrinomonadaceae bacterium]